MDDHHRATARWVLALVVAAISLWKLFGPESVGPSRPGTTKVSAGPAALPAPKGEEFGANVNRLFNDGTFSIVEIDRQIASLSATGATLARSDALWEATEPRPPRAGVHHYTWAFDDRITLVLAEHGLRWLPIIDYSPSWAQSIRGVEHSPPIDDADYAAYAAAVAGRYGYGGRFWRGHPRLRSLPVQTFEIWNEPDDPAFWRPAPDPRRYAALYSATRSAIKAVDPSARVIIGGLTDPRRFLPAVLHSDPGLRTRIDGVAIHPYGRNPAAVLAAVRSDRAILDRLGLGETPLYVTEFGWVLHPSSAPVYAPADTRPRYIDDTITALAGMRCGVTAVLLYTWVTPMRDLANLDDWYGISPPGGGISPAMRAFDAGVRSAERTGARRLGVAASSTC